MQLGGRSEKRGGCLFLVRASAIHLAGVALSVRLSDHRLRLRLRDQPRLAQPKKTPTTTTSRHGRSAEMRAVSNHHSVPCLSCFFQTAVYATLQTNLEPADFTHHFGFPPPSETVFGPRFCLRPQRVFCTLENAKGATCGLALASPYPLKVSVGLNGARHVRH